MSLDTPLTTDTAGITTTIISDGITTENVLTTAHLPTDLESTSESIKDFLAKPYLIYQGAWTTSNLAGDQLFGGLGLATDTLLESITLWYDKIKGFSMIRCTMVLRLQLNATPFHMGKLLLHFLPATTMHDAIEPTMDNYTVLHNWSLTSRSMQPSIDLDCRETAVEMRIPYIMPTTHYLLGAVGGFSSKFSRGTAFLSVLSPLRAGTSGNSLDYTFYVSWEDVELVAPIVPQSGRSGRRKGLGTMKEKEASAMTTTPVAQALSVAGKIASTLGSIPVLSSIATPASWVLNAASGLASAFGWSKPTNTETPGAMSRQFQRFAATSDGADYAYPLAMSCTNHVTTMTAKTITDDDEMSFSYLKSIPAYISTINWLTTAAQGSSLLSIDLGPRQIFSRAPLIRAGTTKQLDSMPPFCYLSSLFRQYRGSIKVKIKIAKTEFHSGRLQITWTPRVLPPTAPTVTSSFYAMREIIDIRAGNEIEFTLPYMMPTAYLDVDLPMGQLDVIVLNALRAPATVSPSIDLLFYYSAGEDFELAVPGYSAGTSNWPPFSPESFGNAVAAADTLVSEGIGGAPIARADLTYAETCVGEIFMSCRQILARYNQIWTSTAPTGAGTRTVIWPWFAACKMLTAAGAVDTAKFGGDPYSFIAPMYAYYRGGMKLMLDTGPSTGALNATLTPGQVTASSTVIRESTSLNGVGPTVTYDGSNLTTPAGSILTDSGIGLLAVEVPYYCKTPISNVMTSSRDLIPTTLTGLVELTVPQAAVTIDTPNPVVIYRAIAEDFQFCYFVGCPPLERTSITLAATTPSILIERSMPLTSDGSHDEVLFFATS